ncbi:MAG: ribosome-associated translation inhibitor RaiA [Chloroflexota bacterium]
MELKIKTRHLELTPQLGDYLERKFGKLGRHLPNLTESKIELREEKTRAQEQHFVAQVTIDCCGTLLRAEERGGDLFTAIDKAADIMQRQIDRYKEKMMDKGRGISLARGEGMAESAPELTAEEPAEKTPAGIVKIKRFELKPMSRAEALEQMELLGHDFFLFWDAETQAINLLYRRREGNFGLIQPER